MGDGGFGALGGNAVSLALLVPLHGTPGLPRSPGGPARSARLRRGNRVLEVQPCYE